MLVLVASAVGALMSMFTVGHRQRSVVLMAMFTVWVLSPFVALWLINGKARRWDPPAGSGLEYATVLISLAALGRYVWVLIRPVEHQPASTFMIVPFASWVAIAVAAGVARRQSRSV